MRTTIELPDELLARAKSTAAMSGVSLKTLFIDALESRLSAPSRKTRRPPPVIGGQGAPRLTLLPPEEIDEAMFG